MRFRTWLIVGSLTGLAGWLLLDIALQLPTLQLQLVKAPLAVFGALVAAFVYEGGRVAGGGEPNLSNDAQRRLPLRTNPQPRTPSGSVV